MACDNDSIKNIISFVKHDECFDHKSIVRTIILNALETNCLAKKPKVLKEKTSERPIYQCRCGHSVGYFKHHKLIKSFYCQYCGQKIDWSDIKEEE